MTDRGILRSLSNTLTRLVKQEIIRQDLIDTGRMLRTIEIFAEDGPGLDFSISVSAEDYFVYVDGNYNVMENVVNSKPWEDAIEKAIDEKIQLKLNQ
jgi:hypothetical protein